MNQEIVKKIKEEIKDFMGNNIGIFIDYDNMYHGFRDFGISIEDENYNIINLIWEIYNRDKIRTIRAYADFDQVKVSLRNLHINRVQIRQVYGNGLGEKYRKNASDIELSIDAIESTYKNSIDTYVFMTADSDMIPIMSRMIFKGKKVHLFYLSTNTSQYQDITTYAHYSQDLIDVLEIDKKRGEPDFWETKVINFIDEWYKDERNADKMYGAKWLNNDIQNKFGVSYNLASKIIEHLENNGLICKQKNNKGVEGFILTKKE